MSTMNRPGNCAATASDLAKVICFDVQGARTDATGIKFVRERQIK